MVDYRPGSLKPVDVAIIGGGPSGLSAAIELKKLGVDRVVVLERESEAGGIPRHCGHPPFGMREFKRVLTGPKYARRLVEIAESCGVEIHLLTTVVEALPNGELLLATTRGVESITANRVIYATGVRETPRSARLVSGDRISGILNTGALQSMIYLKGRIPFKRPVIIGTELVSYSAIMTCRHAGVKPVAMIEERLFSTARFPSSLYPKMLGIPLHLNTRLLSISGKSHVEWVEIEQDGVRRKIACDGVILSGQFVPESALARCGHLDVDAASGGPLVDQFGRCSDPSYYATGNLLRPVETAGWCWNEGRQTARRVADDLHGIVAKAEIALTTVIDDPAIKLVIPQNICTPLHATGMTNFQLRFSRTTKGELVVKQGDAEVYRRSLSVHPERRVLIPIGGLINKEGNSALRFGFIEQT